MVVRVVDASVIAALLFGGPEAVAEQLADARLAAPALLGLGLAKVQLVNGERHPAQRNALSRAFPPWRRFGIEEVEVDHEAALALAVEHGLGANDTSTP